MKVLRILVIISLMAASLGLMSCDIDENSDNYTAFGTYSNYGNTTFTLYTASSDYKEGCGPIDTVDSQYWITVSPTSGMLFAWRDLVTSEEWFWTGSNVPGSFVGTWDREIGGQIAYTLQLGQDGTFVMSSPIAVLDTICAGI